MATKWSTESGLFSVGLIFMFWIIKQISDKCKMQPTETVSCQLTETENETLPILKLTLSFNPGFSEDLIITAFRTFECI